MPPMPPAGYQGPPQPQGPPRRDRGRWAVIGLVTIAVFLVLGVSVGIAVITTNENRASAPVAAPTSSEAAQTTSNRQDPTEQGPQSPAATTLAPVNTSSAGRTGDCPTTTREVFHGQTDEFTVRICASESVTQTYTYVGGSDVKGYVVLQSTLSSSVRSGSSAGFSAANGVASYTVSSSRLLVERADSTGRTVLVDQSWISGTMVGVDRFSG